MVELDLSTAEWRKSTHSSDNTGGCVSAAVAGGAVVVRDSKDPEGSVITCAPGMWGAFLEAVRAGELSC